MSRNSGSKPTPRPPTVPRELVERIRKAQDRPFELLTRKQLAQVKRLQKKLPPA